MSEPKKTFCCPHCEQKLSLLDSTVLGSFGEHVAAYAKTCDRPLNYFGYFGE